MIRSSEREIRYETSIHVRGTRDFAIGNNSDAEARGIAQRIETRGGSWDPCTTPALAFGASLVGPWLRISGKFRIQENDKIMFRDEVGKVIFKMGCCVVEMLSIENQL